MDLPFDAGYAALVIGTFLVAGFVKGIAGFGMPTVTLGILALVRPLPEAMALMLVPALATNVWQALAGPALRPMLRRLRGFLLAAGLGALAGAGILARLDAVLLGLLLVLSAGLALSGWPMPPPGPRREAWVSPLMGLASGLLTGMTGSFIMPAAPYFAALRLPPQEFVQGFGLGVVVATTALAIGMAGAGLLPAEMGFASLAGVAPAFAGMALGQRVRRGLPDARFRQVVQAALGVLGVYLAVRAFR
jgi:uncharacterized membrane protein YfcA